MKHSALTTLVVAMFGLVAAMVAPASAASQSSTSDLWKFSDGSAVEGAWSNLVRTSSGVSTTINTIAPPGDAVTVWWVVFNNPEECEGAEGSEFRCSEPDLFNPDVESSVQYAAGHVVGESGEFNIGAHLREGDTSGCDLEALGGEGFLCAGLIDAEQADVHLVVRTHGPKLPAFLPEQIRTFFGGCTPDSSLGLGDGPNTCIDMQFAVHETL